MIEFDIVDLGSAVFFISVIYPRGQRGAQKVCASLQYCKASLVRTQLSHGEHGRCHIQEVKGRGQKPHAHFAVSIVKASLVRTQLSPRGARTKPVCSRRVQEYPN